MCDKQLDKPLYFYNIKTGDLYFIWWKRNIPSFRKGWVRIPEWVWKWVMNDLGH